MAALLRTPCMTSSTAVSSTTGSYHIYLPKHRANTRIMPFSVHSHHTFHDHIKTQGHNHRARLLPASLYQLFFHQRFYPVDLHCTCKTLSHYCLNQSYSSSNHHNLSTESLTRPTSSSQGHCCTIPISNLKPDLSNQFGISTTYKPSCQARHT